MAGWCQVLEGFRSPQDSAVNLFYDGPGTGTAGGLKAVKRPSIVAPWETQIFQGLLRWPKMVNFMFQLHTVQMLKNVSAVDPLDILSPKISRIVQAILLHGSPKFPCRLNLILSMTFLTDLSSQVPYYHGVTVLVPSLHWIFGLFCLPSPPFNTIIWTTIH